VDLYLDTPLPGAFEQNSVALSDDVNAIGGITQLHDRVRSIDATPVARPRPASTFVG